MWLCGTTGTDRKGCRHSRVSGVSKTLPAAQHTSHMLEGRVSIPASQPFETRSNQHDVVSEE